jgi:hypothetical protein
MKRLIAAVSFAVLAVPAFAADYGKPYADLDLDRVLPQINFPAVQASNVDPRSLPYEQAQVDRILPNFDTGRVQVAAASGTTISDASIATDAQESSQEAKSPWANDWNFIAPAL